MSRRSLCLDWDKRCLRIVVARVGSGRIVLEDAHSHRIPNTVETDDPEALGAFIRGMLRRHRLRFHQVVVDVPRERAVINRLTLPPTPAPELAAAVRFQALKELPFPLDSAAIDYVVLKRNDDDLATDVLLAAITVETLDRVRLTCEAAGLKPARIGLRPYANVISTSRVLDTGDRRVLFVDIGPAATEIDVIVGDTLAFARSANVSVPLVAGEAAGHEDSRIISIADVATLADSDEAVEAAVNELLVETTRTLQSYRATVTEGAIDEVLVAGGTGVESQLADRLARRLELPARLFDPTPVLGISPDEAPKLRSFSAALGLAWGISREGSLALDFLNPKRPVPRGDILQRRARIGAMAGAIFVLAATVVALRQYRAVTSERDALIAMNERLLEDARARQILMNRVDEVRDWSVDAVWPDEFLNLVRLADAAGARPGEKLMTEKVEFRGEVGQIGMRLSNLYLSDRQVFDALAAEIRGWKEKDKPPYDVRPTRIQQVPEARKFSSRVDSLTIHLREQQEFRSKELVARRAKERQHRLQKLGQVDAGATK